MQKITAINAKHGPFDAVFLVGDAFKEGSTGEELEGLTCMSSSLRDAASKAHSRQSPCQLTSLSARQLSLRQSGPGSKLQGVKSRRTLSSLVRRQDRCRTIPLTARLANSSVLTTAQGLKVACIGGKYDESAVASSETVCSAFVWSGVT